MIPFKRARHLTCVKAQVGTQSTQDGILLGAKLEGVGIGAILESNLNGPCIYLPMVASPIAMVQVNIYTAVIQ